MKAKCVKSLPFQNNDGFYDTYSVVYDTTTPISFAVKIDEMMLSILPTDSLRLFAIHNYDKQFNMYIVKMVK